jgi:hypothetical protein
MGKVSREWVIEARDGLRGPDRRTEAMTALRAMVEEIVLTPEAGELGIVLKVHLAAMPAAASPKQEASAIIRVGARRGHPRCDRKDRAATPTVVLDGQTPALQ